jgi:hypothetical protein
MRGLMSELGQSRRATQPCLPFNVRYTPDSDRIGVAVQYVAKGQQETHAPQQMAFAFNDRIGAGEQLGRNVSLRAFRRFEIDDEFKCGRRLHRQVDNRNEGRIDQSGP